LRNGGSAIFPLPGISEDWKAAGHRKPGYPDKALSMKTGVVYWWPSESRGIMDMVAGTGPEQGRDGK